MIAALCVSRNSIYKTLPGVDCYDMDRDVRTFNGGVPIVAHPPCRAWSAYCAHQAKPLPGEKELAPMCVNLLKQNGGVLEHPAHSRLWQALDLPRPGETRDGLWCIQVNQSWWGDTRTKKTWLLFSGVDKGDVVLPFALHNANGDRRRWQVMSKIQRAATCEPLARWLVEIASRTRSPIHA